MTEIAAVELRQVGKIFPGGIKAVETVTLRIPPGQIVALLGASGSGKTTTLRLINRLEEATSGTVLVRGHDVRGQRPEVLRRSIGYVIQESGLFPHVTVSANVATVPRLLKWPGARIRERVAQVLELVGLPEKDFGARMPSELSGGQRQRVGVARALAADPDILLMDEPFGALDPGTRQALHEEFLQLHARLKKTVVLVTHDIVEAGRLASAIVLLDRGRIIQEGTLRELLLRPVDERVRSFLGRNRLELALAMLRLGQILDGLEESTTSTPALRLAADTSLGKTLAALANLDECAAVAIDNGNTRTYSVRNLRTRLHAELKSSE